LFARINTLRGHLLLSNTYRRSRTGGVQSWQILELALHTSMLNANMDINPVEHEKLKGKHSKK
jgi:hypothetical protein